MFPSRPPLPADVVDAITAAQHTVERLWVGAYEPTTVDLASVLLNLLAAWLHIELLCRADRG